MYKSLGTCTVLLFFFKKTEPENGRRRSPGITKSVQESNTSIVVYFFFFLNWEKVTKHTQFNVFLHPYFTGGKKRGQCLITMEMYLMCTEKRSSSAFPTCHVVVIGIIVKTNKKKEGDDSMTKGRGRNTKNTIFTWSSSQKPSIHP